MFWRNARPTRISEHGPSKLGAKLWANEARIVRARPFGQLRPEYLSTLDLRNQQRLLRLFLFFFFFFFFFVPLYRLWFNPSFKVSSFYTF